MAGWHILVASSSKIGMETKLNSELHLSDLHRTNSISDFSNVHINSHIKLTEKGDTRHG